LTGMLISLHVFNFWYLGWVWVIFVVIAF